MNIFRKTPRIWGTSFFYFEILNTFGFVNPYPNPILYPYLRQPSASGIPGPRCLPGQSMPCLGPLQAFECNRSRRELIHQPYNPERVTNRNQMPPTLYHHTCIMRSSRSTGARASCRVLQRRGQHPCSSRTVPSKVELWGRPDRIPHCRRPSRALDSPSCQR